MLNFLDQGLQTLPLEKRVTLPLGRNRTGMGQTGQNRDEPRQNRDEIHGNRAGKGHVAATLVQLNKHSQECIPLSFARFCEQRPRPLVETVSASRGKARPQEVRNGFVCPIHVGIAARDFQIKHSTTFRRLTAYHRYRSPPVAARANSFLTRLFQNAGGTPTLLDAGRLQHQMQARCVCCGTQRKRICVKPC